MFHRQFAKALTEAGWGHASKTPKTEHVAPDVLPKPPVAEHEPPLWQLPYGNKWADFIAGIIAQIAKWLGAKP